ncbi:MAG: HelD family protein [Raoultibacter sp.]
MQTDPIFEEEQQHLSKIYDQLESMAFALEAKMEKNSKDAAADKIAMSSELSPNFASYSDAMETYADFASVNRVIDAYNLSESIDTQKLKSIQVLLRQPYFAKVVLQFNPGEEPKELYIGTAGISDESYRRLVVDWRSAVAEVFYNQESGHTSYQANGRTIEVDLILRRQFDIDKNELKAYFDTTVAIQDSLLLASLSKQRSSHMQAITTTIQKEQNHVIRHEDVPSLLVNGIAGSGKTSVLMQRVAYLFYQQREKLSPDEVFLLTPNPVFQHYIEKVLPDLGEKNPECMTWDEFMEGLMPHEQKGGSVFAELETLKRIDAACENPYFDSRDFKEIRCEDERLLSVAQINQVANKYKNISSGPHRVTLMREELMKRLESRFSQLANSEKVLNEISSLSPDEQLSLFRETFDAQDEDEARLFARRYVELRYAGARLALENDEWLRIGRIGMRVLRAENLGSVEWLYLKLALTGLCKPETKYVMIDEVQDYTLAQLAILTRYFKRAHFILLGDENQAIHIGTASFDEIREFFQEARGPLKESRLLTSYRSTSEITQLFAGLLEKDERLKIRSVQRSDKAPIITAYEDEEEYEEALSRAIYQAEENEGLTAVILPHKYQVKQLKKKLGENSPFIIDAQAILPSHGVILVPLKLAKGLEFDHVIVADASDRVFPDDELSRRRLYTSISRATRTVTILAKGTLTPLLR